MPHTNLATNDSADHTRTNLPLEKKINEKTSTPSANLATIWTAKMTHLGKPELYKRPTGQLLNRQSSSRVLFPSVSFKRSIVSPTQPPKIHALTDQYPPNRHPRVSAQLCYSMEHFINPHFQHPSDSAFLRDIADAQGFPREVAILRLQAVPAKFHCYVDTRTSFRRYDRIFRQEVGNAQEVGYKLTNQFMWRNFLAGLTPAIRNKFCTKLTADFMNIWDFTSECAERVCLNLAKEHLAEGLLEEVKRDMRIIGAARFFRSCGIYYDYDDSPSYRDRPRPTKTQFRRQFRPMVCRKSPYASAYTFRSPNSSNTSNSTLPSDPSADSTLTESSTDSDHDTLYSDSATHASMPTLVTVSDESDLEEGEIRPSICTPHLTKPVAQDLSVALREIGAVESTLMQVSLVEDAPSVAEPNPTKADITPFAVASAADFAASATGGEKDLYLVIDRDWEEHSSRIAQDVTSGNWVMRSRVHPWTMGLVGKFLKPVITPARVMAVYHEKTDSYNWVITISAQSDEEEDLSA